MSRNRDPLVLSPHWHVDCRLEDELPDDNVVGTRFLINAAFGAVTVAAIIFTGWLFYLSFNLRYQIHDWEQRIGDNRAEVHDIQRMQREYSTEAAKIDQAYALVRPQFSVSSLLSNLGRTRPEQMMVEAIEWSEPGVIIMRGSLKETSERASLLLGSYVKQLSHDEKIGPLCREIVLTDVDRGTTGDLLKFEIALRLKPSKS
jgi:hypothetical protein